MCNIIGARIAVILSLAIGLAGLGLTIWFFTVTEAIKEDAYLTNCTVSNATITTCPSEENNYPCILVHIQTNICNHTSTISYATDYYCQCTNQSYIHENWPPGKLVPCYVAPDYCRIILYQDYTVGIFTAPIVCLFLSVTLLIVVIGIAINNRRELMCSTYSHVD